MQSQPTWFLRARSNPSGFARFFMDIFYVWNKEIALKALVFRP